MNFAMNQPSPPPLRRASGFLTVVLLHVLIVYGLVSGLARKVVEVIKKPLETHIIEEVKLPPPPPPPPPPPKQIKQEVPPPEAAPPPPYVPPPEITPPAVAAPTIEAVTAPPVEPPPPIAPPAPVPALAGPVRTDISVACPQQVAPEMPAKALQEGLSGVVRAAVRIKAGKVVEVQIQSGPRVFHNAVRAAMMRYQCASSGEDEVVATQEFAFKVE